MEFGHLPDIFNDECNVFKRKKLPTDTKTIFLSKLKSVLNRERKNEIITDVININESTF